MRLCRVCIVNDQGNVLMDKFVRQKERVTDYRTKWSGIRAADLASCAAASLEEVQKEAAELFKDRILVGHAIENDLKVSCLSLRCTATGGRCCTSYCSVVSPRF